MIIFILAICLFVIMLYFSIKNDKDLSLEEKIFEDEQMLDINYRDRFYNRKEPEFYHPVTGYKGTKSEMDAYIINRERKLRNNEL